MNIFDNWEHYVDFLNEKKVQPIECFVMFDEFDMYILSATKSFPPIKTNSCILQKFIDNHTLSYKEQESK